MIYAIDAAKYVCAKGDWKVSNLALQKMLYLLQMIHLGRFNKRLFEGEFQAWDYGPVEPSVYRSVAMFGSNPIQDGFAFKGARNVADEGAIAFLNEGCDYLLRKSAGQLVSLTHWTGGAWAKHYKPDARGIEIPDADILEEYRKRTNG